MQKLQQDRFHLQKPLNFTECPEITTIKLMLVFVFPAWGFTYCL